MKPIHLTVRTQYYRKNIIITEEDIKVYNMEAKDNENIKHLG